MDVQPLLDAITARERAVTYQAEQLRSTMEELAAQLRENEQELEHLGITRKTVLAFAEEVAAQPPEPTPDLPEHPAYQQILAAFAHERRPLRARDLCEALDLGFTPKTVEGMRAKLKRLVKRGILTEPEPGLFTQPSP
jgi:predicted transcriptional regulator